MEGNLEYASCLSFSQYNPVNEFEDEKDRILPFFSFLDHTSSPCCVLSKEGEIMFCNKSWNIFVLEHNTTPSPHSFKGRNYFSLKDNSTLPGKKEVIGGLSEVSTFFEEIRSTLSPQSLLSDLSPESEPECPPLSPPPAHLTLGNLSPTFSFSSFQEPKKKIQIRYSYFTPKAEFEFKAKASKEVVEGKGYIVIKHEVVNLKKLSQPNNDTPVGATPTHIEVSDSLPMPRIEPVGLRVASLPPEERTISKLVKRIREMEELFAVLDYCSSHCCLLNLKGEILYTNVAWNIFCVENGGDSSTNYKGYNYLTVSCSSPADGISDYSEEGGEYMGFLEGVKRLVAGHTLEEIQIEYPCHSDTEKRFFIATGYNVFLNNDRFILISHELVCQKKIKKGDRETTRTNSPSESTCPSSSSVSSTRASSPTAPDTPLGSTTTQVSVEDKSAKRGTTRKADELEGEEVESNW
eukprot:TRINITY_DN1152_c0_g1_i6.p1 TRINITY_DN1152_c0_g1~~TRINITY_DN1152_c0_g1_i6.p1  ORF type:complete len:464 (-),score=79.13 TRINITY_DN1152_c0_g1_i6:428-1819(-)